MSKQTYHFDMVGYYRGVIRDLEQTIQYHERRIQANEGDGAWLISHVAELKQRKVDMKNALEKKLAEQPPLQGRLPL